MRTARAGMRAGVRLTGATLLLGALGIWIAAGTPGIGTVEFGDAPDTISVTGAADAASAPVEREERADDDHTAGPAFTTTAPRGPVDPSTWPRSVLVPALAVDAPVLAVGLGSEGELIVPHSPMDVGWYQGGAVPGEPGVALLTSHVDTRTQGRGVFAGLVRLEAGDTVTIRSASGEELRWVVTARTQHDKQDLPDALFARTGTPVLALVTCGGPFDASTRSYRDNVIVWAELER